MARPLLALVCTEGFQSAEPSTLNHQRAMRWESEATPQARCPGEVGRLSPDYQQTGAGNEGQPASGARPGRVSDRGCDGAMRPVSEATPQARCPGGVGRLSPDYWQTRAGHQDQTSERSVARARQRPTPLRSDAAGVRSNAAVQVAAEVGRLSPDY